MADAFADMVSRYCATCATPLDCAKRRCLHAGYRQWELIENGDYALARRIFKDGSVFLGEYVPPWELPPEPEK